MLALISAIQFASLLLTILVLADILVSYVLDPYHPIRRSLDAVVQPMLDPIRRIMPNVGMLDFSPVVLLILIRVVEEVLIRILINVA